MKFLFTKLSIILLPVAISAHPGAGKSQCKTDYITSETCYTTQTVSLSTSTIWEPVITESPSTWYITSTLYSTETSYTTISYPSVVTNWITSVGSTLCEVPYTSVCTETTEVPITTSAASVSICTEEVEVPVTTQVVRTETLCCTQDGSGNWGPWLTLKGE